MRTIKNWKTYNNNTNVWWTSEHKINKKFISFLIALGSTTQQKFTIYITLWLFVIPFGFSNINKQIVWTAKIWNKFFKRNPQCISLSKNIYFRFCLCNFVFWINLCLNRKQNIVCLICVYHTADRNLCQWPENRHFQ